MHEGTVSDKLTRKVTHIVAYTSSENPVAFQTLLRRCVFFFVSIECKIRSIVSRLASSKKNLFLVRLNPGIDEFPWVQRVSGGKTSIVVKAGQGGESSVD